MKAIASPVLVVLLFSCTIVPVMGQQPREVTPEERELVFLMGDLADGVYRSLDAAVRAGNLGLKAKAAIPKLDSLVQSMTKLIASSGGDEMLVKRAEDVRREATIALKRIKGAATARKVASGGKTVQLIAIERDTGESSRIMPNKPDHVWMRVTFKTNDPDLSVERIETNPSKCGVIRAGSGETFSPSGGGLFDENPGCVFLVEKKALNLALELPGYPPLTLGF